MSAVERAFCRSRPWSALARRTVLPWALQGIRPAGELLELGSGDGAMAAGMAHTFPNLNLVVSDIDPVMVRAARSRFRGNERVAVHQADVAALPFGEARFDTVASFLMLHHVIDWQQALAEMRRVLKPGGTLVGYDLHRSHLAELIHVVDRSPHRLLERDEFEPGLRAAGFDKARVSSGLGGYVTKFVAEVPD